MRRLLVPIALAVIVIGGAGLYLFKREMVVELYEANILGYGTAKTPQECTDRFKKAIKERNYKLAAKYVNKDYGELLIKAATAGKDLGQAIDDLTYRMDKDGVLTSEIKVILFLNDPFPTALKIVPKSTGDSGAIAALDLEEPELKNPSTGAWKHDPSFIQGFYAGQGAEIKMVKQSDGAWKLDFQVNPLVRNRFDRVVTVHKDYVNAFKKMSEEVRVERTTKENVTSRLKELVAEAVRAPQ